MARKKKGMRHDADPGMASRAQEAPGHVRSAKHMGGRKKKGRKKGRK